MHPVGSAKGSENPSFSEKTASIPRISEISFSNDSFNAKTGLK